ncbi:putative ribonuclease H protein [Vitis vinifera]|uniref:Putative ribonuclease H protein n=1 Tax=Vitis vinifera TaxID=29760 RepID=A0A438H3G4_VITVI|nr:putative ribonuclease H protein [Vitis vinifera]
MLEAPFSEEEVFGALSDLNGDKAPGPDGFTMAFCQFNWSFLKEEVMGFFKDFHDQGKFVKNINAFFLVLIPKKGGAEDLKDFRSISLVGSLYKLLAKVLANRLKKVSYLSWLLMWFEAMSGLKVNLYKSEIIAVGRVENVEEVALEFGCKVSKLPFTYLGLPLGARFKEVATWDGVEERLRKRLSIWKMHYIYKRGRMTFIRSTLSSMPIYGMSLFQMPRSVSSRLERIQRDFLWGGGALERKPHLVEWYIICSDKRKGGLGVRSLAFLNKALLCKWSWRFAMEREALWRQVISAKYGEEEGGWRSCVVRGSYGVGLWKAIRRGWEAVGNNLVYSVGNGRRIRFWEEKWCGDDKLCSLFPSLYAISLDKEAWVADVWSHYGGGVWAPRFSRRINDWEVIEVEHLLLRLQGRRVYSDVKDEVIWTKAKDGRFSVKSLYKDLDPERREEFPANIIWNSLVPPRRKNLLITSSCIVGWPEVYGAYFSLSLEFRGCSSLQ